MQSFSTAIDFLGLSLVLLLIATVAERSILWQLQHEHYRFERFHRTLRAFRSVANATTGIALGLSLPDICRAEHGVAVLVISSGALAALTSAYMQADNSWRALANGLATASFPATAICIALAQLSLTPSQFEPAGVLFAMAVSFGFLRHVLSRIKAEQDYVMYFE